MDSKVLSVPRTEYQRGDSLAEKWLWRSAEGLPHLLVKYWFVHMYEETSCGQEKATWEQAPTHTEHLE